MRGLLTELRKQYQHVLIHVGPILQSQDALTVARHVDSILLVVKADATRREVVNRAMDSIRDARPKVIGAVLTERTQTIPNAVYRRI
jgi:polysaccharide biosynthesis transport protein